MPGKKAWLCSAFLSGLLILKLTSSAHWSTAPYPDIAGRSATTKC